MKVKHLVAVTVIVGTMYSGYITIDHEANAKVYAQNGITLHDDSLLAEHELSYIDTLLNKDTDAKTLAYLKSYFADKGLYSVQDIIKKAQQDGLDTSKYAYLLN